MNPEWLDRIRKLVSEGMIQEALDLFDDSSADTNILSLKSRLKLLLKKKIRGTISFEQETIVTNSIVDSLLQWTVNSDSTVQYPKEQQESVKVDAQLITLIKNKLVQSLNFYYTVTIALLTSGLVLATLFYLDNGISTIEGFGSAFISSVSGLSIREIINRRDRISFLEILLIKTNNITDRYEIQKVNTLSWSIIESTILNSKTNGK